MAQHVGDRLVKENLEKISDINRELMRRLKAKNKKRKNAKAASLSTPWKNGPVLE